MNKIKKRIIGEIISLEDNLLKTKNKKYQCCFIGCNEDSIGSHVISKTQLSKIAKNDKVYSLNVRIKNGFNNENYKFELTQCASTYKYPLFCNKHDGIFSKNKLNVDVDKCSFERENENAVLLFSYRYLSAVNYRLKYVINARKNVLGEKKNVALLANRGFCMDKCDNQIINLLNNYDINYQKIDNEIKNVFYNQENICYKPRCIFSLEQTDNDLIIKQLELNYEPLFLGVLCFNSFFDKNSLYRQIITSFIDYKSGKWHILIAFNKNDLETINFLEKSEIKDIIFWSFLCFFMVNMVALNANIFKPEDIKNINNTTNFLTDKKIKKLRKIILSKIK